MIGKLGGRVSGLARTIATLPAIAADSTTVNQLLDRYGRMRLAYESAAGSLLVDMMALADATLPAAVADGAPVQALADLRGRLRLAAENVAQDKILTEIFGFAHTTLPAAVGSGTFAGLLTDLRGRARLAAENTAQDKIKTENFGLAHSTLPGAVGSDTFAAFLTDLRGRVRLSAESADQARILTELYALVDTTLPAAAGDGDPVRPLADEYGRLRPPHEDVANNLARIGEQDPLSAQYEYDTLVELTGIASGADEFLYFDLDGYRLAGIQIEIDAGSADSVTVTFQATMEDAAEGVATYQERTLEDFTVANTVVDTMWIIDNLTAYKRGRLRYVTAGGNGDGAITIFLKQMW